MAAGTKVAIRFATRRLRAAAQRVRGAKGPGRAVQYCTSGRCAPSLAREVNRPLGALPHLLADRQASIDRHVGERPRCVPGQGTMGGCGAPVSGG